jgi:hypothetical protein
MDSTPKTDKTSSLDLAEKQRARLQLPRSNKDASYQGETASTALLKEESIMSNTNEMVNQDDQRRELPDSPMTQQSNISALDLLRESGPTPGPSNEMTKPTPGGVPVIDLVGDQSGSLEYTQRPRWR